MAKHELRGASRREFIKGAFALGAAMGWGPSRIWDFIARGAGDAAADCKTKGTQNLVLLVGAQGAHGYPNLLWPQPDSFYTGRFNPDPQTGGNQLAVHFLQNTGNGGVATNLGGAIRDAQYSNYSSAAGQPMAAPSTIAGGAAWGQGEKFRRLMGADNMAFRGFVSPNATSRQNDMTAHGLTGNQPVPGNKTLSEQQKLQQNFLIAARETPWLKYGPKKWITSVEGGSINPFHVNGAHNGYIDFNKKWSVMAAAATIQLTRPTIAPVILVGDMSIDSNTAGFYGTLPGAPPAAFVGAASGMVDLFNSNAAKLGGILNNGQANATLFEAYTKAFIGNSKTARLPTFSRGYKTAKLSANLVGLNLSEKLLPNDADRLRYGFTGNNPAKFASLRDSLIVTAKALALGLTSQVVIAYGFDDPHDLFTSGGNGGINASTAARIMGNILDGFMDDLMAVKDPFCDMPLGDNTVIGLIGDVPRTGINQNNWNDPSYGGQNRAWIMSNGLLYNGFFGGDRSTRPNEGVTSNDHTARGPGEGGFFDLNTGDLIGFDVNGPTGLIGGQDLRRRYGETAMAAILWAVTRGDERRVNDFYSGKPFPAIGKPVLI